MNADRSIADRSQPQSWMPILVLSVQEVFEIMLGCRVQPMETPEPRPNGEFTAMVGLAGAICGVLTFSCGGKTAVQIAKCMLGPEIASSEDQVSDALGEICNMIGGNFKNKLAGLDGRCMLSVPTVINGGEYSLRSLADGTPLEVVMQFEGGPIVVCLELHN